MAKELTRYRIVANFGHGDRSWVDRGLTREEVLNWFIKVQSWPKTTKFKDLPNAEIRGHYYWEEDHAEEREDRGYGGC